MSKAVLTRWSLLERDSDKHGKINHEKEKLTGREGREKINNLY